MKRQLHDQDSLPSAEVKTRLHNLWRCTKLLHLPPPELSMVLTAISKANYSIIKAADARHSSQEDTSDGFCLKNKLMQRQKNGEKL